MTDIIRKDDETQTVFGWAYQTHTPYGELIIDKSGEFVDDESELEKAAYDFVLKSRNGGADHKRNDNGVMVRSTLVESVVLTKAKREAMGIPEGLVPTGWWVGFHVHDRDTWERVKKGELTSFSIHGKGTRKAVA